MKVLVIQLCLTLCDPMECSLPICPCNSPKWISSLSMKFSKQEYWSRLPFSSPGDFPDPGMEPKSPALAGRFLTIEPPEKPINNCRSRQKYMLQLASEILQQIASTILRFLGNPDLHDYVGFLLRDTFWLWHGKRMPK